MLRSYLMHWLLGYSVMSMLSFPRNSEFGHGVVWMIGFFANLFPSIGV